MSLRLGYCVNCDCPKNAHAEVGNEGDLSACDRCGAWCNLKLEKALTREQVARNRAGKPKVCPSRKSKEYEWHRDSCDVCYGVELEEMEAKEALRAKNVD